MACPNLYIGESYSKSPPDDLQNPAITLDPGGAIKVGDEMTVHVIVRNHSEQTAINVAVTLYVTKSLRRWAPHQGRKLGTVTKAVWGRDDVSDWATTFTFKNKFVPEFSGTQLLVALVDAQDYASCGQSSSYPFTESRLAGIFKIYVGE